MQSTKEPDVQAVFDKVIAAGYYGTPRKGAAHIISTYMCISLEHARNNGVISWVECRLAKIAISEYLTEQFSALSTALAFNNHSPDFVTRYGIYKDWANRPTLTRVF